MGNGIIFCTSHVANPEYAGLLVSCEDEDNASQNGICPESSALLGYDEPRTVNTNNAFLGNNSSRFALSNHGVSTGQGVREDCSLLLEDDDEEEEDVAFDRKSLNLSKNSQSMVNDGIG